MIIQDLDGILGMDDLQDGDPLKQISTAPAAIGVDSLIGRPLAEVERYYSERALDLSDNNREEASKMLGIGERTLYRNIQEWKLQDRIKEAMTNAGGDLKLAARALEMTVDELQKRLKKV